MQQPIVHSQAGLTANPFSYSHYIIKRPFFQFLGRKFYVYAPDGTQVMFIRHPLLKLRHEFTLYTDETERVPLLTLRARQIVALNLAMDVLDPNTQMHLGTVRSRGLKSMVRDTWDILGENDVPVGLMQEDGNSLLRRFIPLLTSRHHIELGGVTVAMVQQQFRFFSKEFVLDLSMNDGRIDPRFAVACGLMCLMAEAEREDRN